MRSVLQRKSRLGSVGGVAVGAFKYGDYVTGSIAYPEMRRYTNNIQSTPDRIQHHLLKGGNGGIPRAGMYRLFRRQSMEVLLQSIALCSNISTPYVYEVATEVISVWCGFTLYLETPYWIRNWQTAAISSSDWNRRLDFSAWWGHDSYLLENKRMVEAICMITGLEPNFVYDLISAYTKKRAPLEKNPLQNAKYFSNWGRSVKQKITGRFFRDRMPTRLGEVLNSKMPSLEPKIVREIEEVAYEMLMDFEGNR